MKVLLSQEQVERRIQELGAELTDFYSDKLLSIIIILHGGLFFGADLARQIKLPCYVDTITLQSYVNDQRGDTITLQMKPKISHAGRNILLVDDVIDSGYSLDFARKWFLEQGAVSVKSCVMVNKIDTGRPQDRQADWHGFDLPNIFLIGMGMDSKEMHRNFPFIATINDD